MFGPREKDNVSYDWYRNMEVIQTMWNGEIEENITNNGSGYFLSELYVESMEEF